MPLIPDELSEGGADTVDDGTTDKDVPVVQAHLPSSFGMTFCVDKSATVLKVEARWGQYKREKKEDQIDAAHRQAEAGLEALTSGAGRSRCG